MLGNLRNESVQLGGNRLDGGVSRTAADALLFVRAEVSLSAAAGTGFPDGIEPRSETPDPDREVQLVKRSESPVQGTKANEAPESTVGEDGDVEVPEPKREIDRRALFPSAANNKKDTLAQQTSSQPSPRFDEGHASGNTMTGSSDGEPSARLAGRSVVGSLQLPSYGVQKAGRVVVRIQVDREGNVTDAIPGIEGTTVQDRSLWAAAKKAALTVHFNANPNAPLSQEGTITYVFKLQ